MNTTPPPLPVDLEAGLRRLRLGAMRQLSPELLVVAKTQRWKPEEFLRTLVEAEIASRDASNARGRLKAAAFPVSKQLDEFDVEASSVPRATFDYLVSLEWITAGRSGGRLGASARVRVVRFLRFGKTHQRLRKGLRRPFYTTSTGSSIAR